MSKAERELLLIVAGWMLRLESGAFAGMKANIPSSEHEGIERQFSTLRQLIADVEAGKDA